ncbi:MAG: response regulator transcription factor [Clostridia bacterium]|nr:response regulator transcription factor [Clostridia bacterium]
MLRIAVCGGKDAADNGMEYMLQDYRDSSKREILWDCYETGRELLRAVDESGEYDVYFLDIDAETGAGLETARTLRSRGFNGKIIFVSESPDYVFRSFEVQPYRYFLKPVPQEDLKKALDEICSSITRRTVVLVKSRNGDCIVPVRDILYIEKVDRTACFHLIDGTTVTSMSFRGGFHTMIDNIEGLGHSFFPYMSGAVVNLMNVRFFKSSSYEIYLRTGEILFCSRTKAAEFRKAFIQYQL